MEEWRRRDLDDLQGQVARALAPLGVVTLAASCKTIRRVTVEHPSGVCLKVVVGIDIRVRSKTYFVSLLRVTDGFNSKLTRIPNFTLRGLTPESADLTRIVERVRDAFSRLLTF